jgi:hypothetical protein
VSALDEIIRDIEAQRPDLTEQPQSIEELLARLKRGEKLAPDEVAALLRADAVPAKRGEITRGPGKFTGAASRMLRSPFKFKPGRDVGELLQGGQGATVSKLAKHKVPPKIKDFVDQVLSRFATPAVIRGTDGNPD